MENKSSEEQISIEIAFYETYCSERKFGSFHFLIGYFIGDFRSKNYWVYRIFPMLKNINIGISFGEDWTDFIWGSACFRKDHVMFLDESMHQTGRKFPPILDENGNPIVDEGGQWLENTEYIEQHYTEFVKLPMDEFIEICKKWYNEVISY